MKREVFVGIDVSGERLDVCVLPEGVEESFDNNDEGVGSLGREIAKRKAALVVLEATGGLERLVVAHLAAEGIAVVVANPRRVRQYAQAAGVLAKTDKVDARVLALFGRDMKPEPRALRSEQEEAIRALVARRSQLMGMRVAETNRLRRADNRKVASSIKAVLKTFERQISAVDAEIDDAIKGSPVWRVADELLRSVPGVGEKTSRMLIAALPEIGRLTSKEAASLAGLAPFAHDSGKMKGRRMIRGGRSSVRRALYMSALVASRHNEDIRVFYQRLRGNGKSGKVALTACMRKLLITLNAVVARGTKWVPKNA